MLGNLLNALPQSLLKALPHKRADLEAKLQGVNGYTGRGEIEFSEWNNGVRTLEVELRGIAGRTADVYADNVFTATVNLDNGRTDYRFNSRKGDIVPALTQGGRIDVRQNGDVILEGVLTPE